MRGEKLSDAIAYDKLHLLQKDFYGYIERNTGKVDANLPVFYGYVISALENSFPDLADTSYDEFIDNVTFKVLDTSASFTDFEYVRKVMANAIRFKKNKNAEIGIHIVVGLRLLKSGDYIHALEYLKKYATMDAKLGTAVVFCYYVLSLKEFKNNDAAVKNHRPGEMELLARELMLSLAKIKPPVNQLRQLEIDNPSFLEKIFWQMIFIGLEWFPSERWFIEIGLKNAAATHDPEMRKRLLDIGAERFYTDSQFLRELYYYKLETRDAPGAAGVVSQLIKQYPDDLEPIYLGLKLSLLTKKKITYHGFRKLAISKGMPGAIIELFDFSFELLNNELKEAMNRVEEFETDHPRMQFYAITLRYIATDFSSNDEMRIRKARKALLDSIEQFAVMELANNKKK